MKKSLLIAMLLVLAMAVSAMATEVGGGVKIVTLSSKSITASGAIISACTFVSGPGSSYAGGFANGVAIDGRHDYTNGKVCVGTYSEAGPLGVSESKIFGAAGGVVIEESCFKVITFGAPIIGTNID
jgi:hypothetical protein